MAMSRRVIRLFALALLSIVVCQPKSHSAETSDGKIYTEIPEIAPVAGQPLPVNAPSIPTAKTFQEGPEPAWIWGADETKTYILKTTFSGPVRSAWLRAACDNSMTLYLNGKKIATSDDFT